jgi:hypothetical protein
MSKFSVMQDIRLPKIPVGYPLKRNRMGETSNQPERLDREEVVFVPLWGLSHCSTRSVCHDGAAWAVLSARIRCRKEAVTALSLGLLASCWALHNSRYGVPSRTESKGSTPRSGAKPADIWTQGRKGNRDGRTVGSAITSWSPRASGLKASWRNRRASDDPQDAQRDRQTGSASSSSERPVVFFWCVVFQKRMVHVASTAARPARDV